MPGSTGADGPPEVCRSHVVDVSRSLILEGCGHWTQQERPDEVNEALLDFLGSLG